MSHSLDGISLKIIRAQEHLNAVKDEITGYHRMNPYTIRAEKKGEVWEFAPIVRQEPPLYLSAIVGDCVTNLRSALDYIIWGLCSRHAGRILEPPPIGRDKPYFPIFQDSNRYQEMAKRLARYKIPASVLAEIESVQPYHGGYEPLWCLRILVNQDKHRLPLLTIGITSTMYLNVADVAESEACTSLSVAESMLPAGFTPNNMQVDSQITGYVTFKDTGMPREPVDVTLENILVTVRGSVVPRFAPFLK